MVEANLSPRAAFSLTPAFRPVETNASHQGQFWHNTGLQAGGEGSARWPAVSTAFIVADEDRRIPIRLLPSLLFHEMAQLTFHRFERVVDDLGQGGVRAVVHLLFFGHQFLARRHGDIDAHAKLVSLLMRMIRLLDCDIAPIDVIAEFFEPSRFLQNKSVDRFRFFDAAVGNVYWPLHAVA
jgi:hypothetical protein